MRNCDNIQKLKFRWSCKHYGVRTDKTAVQSYG